MWKTWRETSCQNLHVFCRCQNAANFLFVIVITNDQENLHARCFMFDMTINSPVHCDAQARIWQAQWVIVGLCKIILLVQWCIVAERRLARTCVCLVNCSFTLTIASTRQSIMQCSFTSQCGSQRGINQYVCDWLLTASWFSHTVILCWFTAVLSLLFIHRSKEYIIKDAIKIICFWLYRVLQTKDQTKYLCLSCLYIFKIN